MQLEERVVRLERSARRWRVLALVLVVAVVAVAAAGPGKEFVGTGFLLKGTSSKQRGGVELSYKNDGYPGLWFRDRKGFDRLFIGLEPGFEMPHIRLMGTKGEELYRFDINGVREGNKFPPLPLDPNNPPKKIVWPAEKSPTWNTLVYVNSGGDDVEYHDANCRFRKRSNTSRMTIRKAKTEGKTPCGVCFKDMWE